MRGLINDCLRRLIALGIRWLGLLLTIVQRVRASMFFWSQKRLARRYGITSATPIMTFGPELELLIERAAARAGKRAKFAWTSGSTAKPKRILYTRRRLRAVKLAYVDFFARCCWSLGIKRTSLYVFSSLNNDDSLTSMLLEETGLPPYISSLQAPYRVHCHPAIQSLVSDYGATAARLWILAIANPGILYSTNPSTLSTFFDELTSDWQRGTRLIKDWHRKPEAFVPAVCLIAKRLESRGSNARLERIAMSDTSLPLQVCAPAVKTCVCWVGGYVKPFLDRLATYLPPDRYRLVPMYSMSTETLETVGHFAGDRVAFLPLASRVLYEFVEEDAEDKPQNLLKANQLQAGKPYSMVVSDPYGLRRYQTGDLFHCRGFVAGLPDLSFSRRRDLEYSFTGEKLTSEQVMTVFQKLREEYPQLGADKFLTCVPSHPVDDSVPHYKIILVNGHGESVGVPVDELATRCDELLSEVNREYKSKCQSARLGPVRFMLLTHKDFIDRIGSSQSNAWKAQFKFLPLYRSTWESLKSHSEAAEPRAHISRTQH
ncbi:MAG: GH3 auxin-responsive promoter family protein [Pyrinomonadaceae bacterium]|nr:GH3 auxin-responsive promoter family protein [Pyrinomonadaceae bacterium]